MGIKRPIKVQRQKWKGRSRQRSLSRSVNAMRLCNADLTVQLRDYFSIAAIVSRFLCLRSPFAVASECINSSLSASEGIFFWNNHVADHSLRALAMTKSRASRSWGAFMGSERRWFNNRRDDLQMTLACYCAISQSKTILVYRRSSNVDAAGCLARRRVTQTETKGKYSEKAAVGWPWQLDNQFMTRHTLCCDETASPSSFGRYGTATQKR